MAEETEDSKMSALLDDDELIARHIVLNDDDVPASYIVPETVRVRALIGQYLATGQDAAQTARDYDVSPEAMQAALAFYARNRQVIDAWLLSHTIQS